MTAKTIENNKVVSITYTLKDEAGNLLDESKEGPLSYLHGHNNIVPGLEKALTGLNVGDKKAVVVPPEEGYGQYNPMMQFKINLEQVGNPQLQPGMMVQLQSQDGNTQPVVAVVKDITGDEVTMDANHPLAGQTLHFDIEIADVREASAEEMTHGHPHGPGGHHHH